MPTTSEWLPGAICVDGRGQDLPVLATQLYEPTCRTDFTQPGFCVANVGPQTSSVAFRQMMVNLKQQMAHLHEERTGQTLTYLSAARFDQQESTKPHRDGGPDECLLMLGYEPSVVASQLEIIDYSRCAFDLALTPRELLARHNPMFRAGYEVLQPYSIRVPCFSPDAYQIVCINNSISSFSSEQLAWQGVLHTALIPAPDETQRRVINSTMIAPQPIGTADTISASQLQEFLKTIAVQRRGYDKQHLQDD